MVENAVYIGAVPDNDQHGKNDLDDLDGQGLGLQAEADGQIWQRVWSEEEKLNFSSTPMFMVRATKSVE